MTLSRVVVLPEKSMRRMKNCLPSSAVMVRSILSVFGMMSKDGSGTKVEETELAVKLAQVFDAFAQLVRGEDVSFMHTEQVESTVLFHHLNLNWSQSPLKKSTHNS